MPDVKCAVPGCNRVRHVPPSKFARLKHPGRVTCGVEHRALAMRGKAHWNWSGGRRVDTKGYVRVLARERDPHAADPYVYEHILVAERHLKRKLHPTERVRHKNRNRADNRWSNLVVYTVRPRRKRAREDWPAA